MAGHGPPPKPPERRAGHNKDSRPAATIAFVRGTQPSLPKAMPDGDSWPARTRSWWKMWRESPLSATFTSTDWSELLDTALLHARLWAGDTKVAPELRLRVAKFGATPEDRARLRITFAQADDADAKRPDVMSSRDRYGMLRSVPDAVESG